MKAFEDGHLTLFNNEKDAFQALHKQNAAIVQYLCNYGHKERVPEVVPVTSEIFQSAPHNACFKTTHNIILEYGESDLEECFAETAPPFLQSEVDAFWRGLFVVADAVKSIHNLKVEKEGRFEEYYG